MKSGYSEEDKEDLVDNSVISHEALKHLRVARMGVHDLRGPAVA